MSQVPTFQIPRSAFVPGQAGLPAATREFVNLPRLLSAAAILFALRAYLTPASKRLAEEGAKACQGKYCQQIHVDRPRNTLLKDQSLGAGMGVATGTIPDVRSKVKSDYYREQLMSPGVQLVAHKVA